MTRANFFERLLGWRARLAVLVLAAILPFAAFIAYQITEIRQKRVTEALERAIEYAQLGADSYEDDLTEARALLELVARIPEVINGSAESCQDFLNSAALSRRWANGLWVVGQSGRVRCSTVANGVGLDLSDREQYRRAVAAGGFHVSDFFIGRLRGQPYAMASILTRAQSGEQLLIGVTLDLAWFDRLAAAVGERAGATVILMDSKGTILSSYPSESAPIGLSIADHPAVRTILAASQGRFEGPRLDGQRAFWGFKRLADTHLRLAVNFERDVHLANLNRGIVQAIVLFAMVSLLIGGLIWFAGNKFFANPMRDLDELLRATLDNMDQGLIVVDKHGTLPICNKRAVELLDLPESLMAARPTAEAVIAYQTAQGEFNDTDDEVRTRLLPRVTGECRNVYERERPNGTVLEVRTVPFAGGAGGVVRTYTDVTVRKQVERLLEELATTDGLTGLANRRHFEATVRSEFARVRRCNNSLALIMADVDHFKAFNDRYGHQAGDACLRSVAGAVQAAIRRPGDTAARYGGEEIVVILPATELAGAIAVAEHIRQAVATLNIEHEASPHRSVTVSLGVAAIASGDQDRTTVEDVLAQADAALYRAKDCGRNRVEAFAAANTRHAAA